ncbi:MAG TPA: response regulator transcription factor [Bacilli bacterium]|nr:response regulator transcription factor [Bacilli bacterium]
MLHYRVLIADDHPLAREAIRSLLAGDTAFEIIGEASDGLEACRMADDLLPDLVLMDIKMPRCDGLEATRRLKNKYPQMKIVILSVSDDVADLFTAIQFGAQGYLLKNLEPDDWLQYLHALLDETTEVPRQLAGRLFHRFQREEEANGSALQQVTPREREILACVAAGDTNRQIAEHLVIAENTVKNHIKNILEKLALENRVQLAAFAVRHGLHGTRTEKSHP